MDAIHAKISRRQDDRSASGGRTPRHDSHGPRSSTLVSLWPHERERPAKSHRKWWLYSERTLEASPSPVYGAALLMRLGATPPPGFKSRSLRPSRTAPTRSVGAVTSGTLLSPTLPAPASASVPPQGARAAQSEAPPTAVRSDHRTRQDLPVGTTGIRPFAGISTHRGSTDPERYVTRRIQQRPVRRSTCHDSWRREGVKPPSEGITDSTVCFGDRTPVSPGMVTSESPMTRKEPP